MRKIFRDIAFLFANIKKRQGIRNKNENARSRKIAQLIIVVTGSIDQSNSNTFLTSEKNSSPRYTAMPSGPKRSIRMEKYTPHGPGNIRAIRPTMVGKIKLTDVMKNARPSVRESQSAV